MALHTLAQPLAFCRRVSSCHLACSLVPAHRSHLLSRHSLPLSIWAPFSPQRDAPCSPHLGLGTGRSLPVLLHSLPLPCFPWPTPAHPPFLSAASPPPKGLPALPSHNSLPLLFDSARHPCGMCLPAHSSSPAGCALSRAGKRPALMA